MHLDRQLAPPPGLTRNHTRGIRPVTATAAAAGAYVAGRWGLDAAAGAAAAAFPPFLAVSLMVEAHRAGEAPWQRWRAR